MIPTIDHKEEVRPGQSITQTVIDGVNVFAFNVKPGDVQWWDQGEGNRGSNGRFNERAELAYAPAPDNQKYRSPYNVTENSGLQVYDIDFWLKQGFPTHVSANHEWAVFFQFHVQPNNKGIKGFGGVTFHDGQFTFENPNGDGSYFLKVPAKPESWFKPSMRVFWASDDSGWVEIWDRVSNKTLGEYHGPNIAKGEFKYLKQGYYRAGGLPEGTVYQTQLKITQGDQVATLAPPTTPSDPGSYNPTPEDLTVLKQALATLITIPPQIQTLQSVLAKVQSDVKAVLDKGPKPWPK